MIYEHLCGHCNKEFEDSYKMNDPVPTKCPLCNKSGKVKRLISAVAGTVVLTGREHVAKLWAEGKEMKKEIYKDEKKYANFIGEDRYQKLQTAIDKNK